MRSLILPLISGLVLLAQGHPARCQIADSDILTTEEGFYAYPGEIAVVLTKGGEDLASTFESFGLSCPTAAIREIAPEEGPVKTEHEIHCDVTKGHERHWKAILESLDGVKEVHWVRATWASASDETPTISYRPLAPSRSIQIGKRDVVKDLSGFFQKFFAGKGLVTETKRLPHRLRLVVSRMRGEILRGKNYWERMEIDAVIVGMKEEFQVVLILDGYLASGSGRAEPPVSRFKDMSMEGRQKELDDYLGRLVVEMTKSLQGGGKG
jgi:hypothetical protein